MQRQIGGFSWLFNAIFGVDLARFLSAQTPRGPGPETRIWQRLQSIIENDL